MTDDMLEVASRQAPVVAERIGYAKVEFRKGDPCLVSSHEEWTEFEVRLRPAMENTAVNGDLSP